MNRADYLAFEFVFVGMAVLATFGAAYAVGTAVLAHDRAYDLAADSEAAVLARVAARQWVTAAVGGVVTAALFIFVAGVFSLLSKLVDVLAHSPPARHTGGDNRARVPTPPVQYRSLSHAR